MDKEATDFSWLPYHTIADRDRTDSYRLISIGDGYEEKDIKQMFKNRISELVNENIDNLANKSEICNNFAKIEELRRLLGSLK